ncbi:MAG TPA: response regulator, partial [Nitrospira sp.]|nr:response regulator [Nitrospira sp.]
PSYVVLEAGTGAAGLAVCQSQRVDCVVFEINLPDMPGFGVLIKLVQRPHHPEMPVIILSRVDLPPLARLAKNNGAQAFLVKAHTSGDQLTFSHPPSYVRPPRNCHPALGLPATLTPQEIRPKK